MQVHRAAHTERRFVRLGRKGREAEEEYMEKRARTHARGRTGRARLCETCAMELSGGNLYAGKCVCVEVHRQAYIINI